MVSIISGLSSYMVESTYVQRATQQTFTAPDQLDTAPSGASEWMSEPWLLIRRPFAVCSDDPIFGFGLRARPDGAIRFASGGFFAGQFQ
jgi:hypothetical protein